MKPLARLLAPNELSTPARHAVARAFRLAAAGGETRRNRLHDLAFAAALIVIGKPGTHIAEQWRLGSVTKHVLAESQGDVLVMCDPRKAPEPSS